MAKKIDYTVTRVPSKDWDNVMETLTLDGSYSDEIKKEVWAAIENMEGFSNPWVVVKIVKEKASATIFGDKDAVTRYIENSRKRSKADGQYFLINAKYHSRW